MTLRTSQVAVVKVGGSLYDMPDLGPRLRQWIDHLGIGNVLIVPGGGAAVNVVRDLDRIHKLGDEGAHWLAVESLVVNAHFLKRVLPHSAVIHHLDHRLPLFRSGAVAILDMEEFARDDDRRCGALPKTWSVTSDSLAVRVAMVTPADVLILLKSVSIPEGMSWEEAARRDLVDAHFPTALAQVRHKLEVRAVNLRKVPFTPALDG